MRDPNLALAGVRIELERMLLNLAAVYGIKHDAKASAIQIARALRQSDVMEEPPYRLVTSVMRVASAAVHGREVSAEDAERTIGYAEAFVEWFIPFMAGGVSHARFERERPELADEVTRTLRGGAG